MTSAFHRDTQNTLLVWPDEKGDTEPFDGCRPFEVVELRSDGTERVICSYEESKKGVRGNEAIAGMLSWFFYGFGALLLWLALHADRWNY